MRINSLAIGCQRIAKDKNCTSKKGVGTCILNGIVCKHLHITTILEDDDESQKED